MYVPKNRASKYIEQKLTEMRGKIDEFTFTVRDYSSFLSVIIPIDRKSEI